MKILLGYLLIGLIYGIICWFAFFGGSEEENKRVERDVRNSTGNDIVDSEKHPGAINFMILVIAPLLWPVCITISVVTAIKLYKKQSGS